MLRGIAGALVVLVVTYIADKFGPKISGLLSAFPTVSATSLIIMSVEHGDRFASDASLSTLFGLTACIFFTLGFYHGYRYYLGESAKKKTSSALIVGFTVYSIFVLVYLYFVSAGTLYNWIPLIATFVGVRLLLTRAKVKKKLFAKRKVRVPEHLTRAALGGGFVVMATVMADFLGPVYGGIFSAFPATVAPILIIISLTRSESFLITAVKRVPAALLATGAFALGVWWIYPTQGVVIGTIIAYVLYGVAIVALNQLERRID